jgi:preprotein translocase SecF subunit
MTALARLIPAKTNLDFVGKRKFCFLLSLFCVLGTVWLLTTKGLNFGIDFTGGTLIEVSTTGDANLNSLRKGFSAEKFGEVTLQEGSAPSGGDGRNIIIRIGGKSENFAQGQQQLVAEAKDVITQVMPDAEFRKVDYVGPQVGDELVKTGALAMGISLLAMLVYLWFRFEWQFGVGGIAALFHDAVMVIGFFALTGLEFNLTSVAAILTVIGYSINDSVVIYDRIRENLRKYKVMSLGDTINLSVNETLSRTILTGGTVLLSLGALVIFGGAALESFSWAMLFGVVIGTYSSVYISAPVLMYTGVKREDFLLEEPSEFEEKSPKARA